MPKKKITKVNIIQVGLASTKTQHINADLCSSRRNIFLKHLSLFVLLGIVFTGLFFTGVSNEALSQSTVPIPSEKIPSVILISQALQLDSNKNVTANIYSKVQAKDGDYADLDNGQYVRVTFQRALTNKNDITLYAKSRGGVTVQVYAENSSQLVTTFRNIKQEGTYRVLLNNLNKPTETFDLKINGDVSIDYIVDPDNWTETQPAGDNDENWSAVASSSDGSHLMAAVDGGRLYISTNYGSSWTETQPAGDNDEYWGVLASSADGSHLVAGVGGSNTGRLYISTNYGGSWTETQPAGDNDEIWGALAVSSNGADIIAGIDYGRLYISTNYGGSWTETQPAGDNDEYWDSAAFGSGNSHIIVGSKKTGGRLYISTNYGGSWTETQPLGDSDEEWISVASNSDGSELLAGIGDGGDLYISSNSGSSWADAGAEASTGDWQSIASSADGTHLIAANNSFVYGGGSVTGSLDISTDSGATWTETNPAGSQRWTAVASSADGSHLIAANSRLYVSVNGSYWVGGSGNWSDAANHWASVSGGSPGSANLPDSATSVFFDSNSGTGAVTVDPGSVSVVNFSNTSGGDITVAAGPHTMNVSGNWTNATGNFASGTGTVNLTGTGSQTITSGGSSFHNLTQNGSGGTYTLQDALTVNHNLGITAGTLDISSSNYAVNVGSAWSDAGTFNAENGTVTLTGTNQSISGSTTFYNLTKSVSSAATLTFQASSTQTIASGGTLTLNGASGQLLSLVSSSPTTQWDLDVAGSSSVSYVNVTDSNASGGNSITPASSTNGGDNPNWNFLSSDATLSNLTISSGTLSPSFASGTTSYTDSVSNSVTSVTVTPTHNQANATITVNGTPVTSGQASGAISLNVGANTITTVVTAQDTVTTDTYTITVTRGASSDATLSNLTISQGSLSPSFASGTTSYTDSVSNSVTSVTVTPTHNQANATITVNGTPVTSGQASGAISLNVGANTITTVVTAQDTVTTDTYTITVTRGASSDATLSNLTISQGSLSPSFASGTTSYTDSVSDSVTSVTVTPTHNQANATITVNGTPVTSGQASGAISLNVGANTITTVVTAQDTVTTDTYTITVTRGASSDATLSNLTISQGSLSPSFASGTTSYTDSVSDSVTSVTVTPTHNQANATITVNGTPVTSGQASGAISLNVGANTITTVVTAQNGSTNTYSITANRAAAQSVVNGGGGGSVSGRGSGGEIGAIISPPIPLTIVPACSSNSQCGASSFVGSPFCRSGGVYQNYTTYTCNDPGQADATCANSTNAQLQDACTSPQTCFDGGCVNIPQYSACNSQNQCVMFNGVGANQCSTSADCAPSFHNACNSHNQCVAVSGPGSNQCQANSDCGSVGIVVAAPPTIVPPATQTPSLSPSPSPISYNVSATTLGKTVMSVGRRAIKKAVNFIRNPLVMVAMQTVSTAGVALTTTVAAAAAATSSSDSDYSSLEAFLVPFGFFKKKRPWGTVYDSVTKQPIDPAYVVLTNVKTKETFSSITDLDGRYGFLVKAGDYTMVVSKTNYAFPSRKLADKTKDELYDSLYFGGMITVKKDEEVITYNIPLDSVNFDWNEFAKKDRKLFKFYSEWDVITKGIYGRLFIVGFVLAIIGFFALPRPYNAIILGLYLAAVFLGMLGVKPKSLGRVINKKTGTPLSFAIVRVLLPKLNVEITHKITDKYGRYYCLVPKGKYYVRIESKNDDGSYSLIYTSPVIDASKKGIIKEKFEF